MGETAALARYVDNNRKHSYYTFCCSVSPDSLTLLLLLLSTSHICMSALFSLAAHTHTDWHAHTVCLCVSARIHAPFFLFLSLSPPPDFPLPSRNFPATVN